MKSIQFHKLFQIPENINIEKQKNTSFLSSRILKMKNKIYELSQLLKGKDDEKQTFSHLFWILEHKKTKVFISSVPGRGRGPGPARYRPPGRPPGRPARETFAFLMKKVCFWYFFNVFLSKPLHFL